MQPSLDTTAEETFSATTLDTFEELEHYLQDLNYEHGIDHAGVIAEGIMYSTFCTDPDGAWILETGDPAERMEDEGGELIYTPLQLPHIKNACPYTVLHVRGIS
jgi:hypothetical protein